MSTADPISLAQTKRLAANADTILLRATRSADLETPIGAFLRLDDGGPAYLLESVEGGERLGRYSFLGVGPRRLLEGRDGQARIQTRPVTVYRLVSADTIEAKVVALQNRKRELFSAVVDDGNMFSSTVSADDIRHMLD